MAKFIEIGANNFLNPAAVALITSNGSKSEITLLNGKTVSVEMYAAELAKKLSAR
jgi:uncharacterized protein YlzI (FlbEa/FlbD family)